MSVVILGSLGVGLRPMDFLFRPSSEFPSWIFEVRAFSTRRVWQLRLFEVGGNEWKKLMNTWNFPICFLYVFVPVFELEHLAFPVFALFFVVLSGADIVQGMLDKAEAKGCEAECNETNWFHSITMRYSWNSKQPVLYGCFNWMIQNPYMGNGWKSPNIHKKLLVWSSRLIWDSTWDSV